MRTRDHFYFKVDRGVFPKINSFTSPALDLRLPKNKFPPEFFFQGENFLCGGYFVSYYPDISANQLILLCRRNRWEEIAKIVGDFLILYYDSSQERIFVLTDQTDKFPCYFSVTPDKIVISTDFYALLRELPFLVLDIIGGLDYIHRNNNVTDRTIIQGIHLVPPATLLIINRFGKYSLKSMIDVESFLNQSFKKYSSIKEFSDVFFLTLESLVRERLRKIDGLSFCSEISSGFDSSLISFLLKRNSERPFVSYSRTAKMTIQDSNPKIVSEFAKKHKLNIKFIIADNLFPFSTEEDLQWVTGANQLMKSGLYDEFLTMHGDKNVIYFTGDGGDEIYYMDEDTQNLYLRFPVQMEYFERLSMRKVGIDKLLTKKGLEVLFGRKRFQEKGVYPLYVSTSAATIHIDTFPLSWETEMWPMTPFIDPRLVQVARGIPKVEDKKLLKQKVWEKRTDIFPPNHFVPKAIGGLGNQISRYLTERRNFVISVLENSLLGEKGWVKSSEVIDNLRNGKLEEYCEENLAGYLAKLIELEYFLQKNKVKVPA